VGDSNRGQMRNTRDANFFRKLGGILLLLLNSVFSSMALALDPEPEEYSLWKHSVKLKFNTTVTGANTVGNLLDFPVLIRLDNSLKIISQSLPNGADLRFADADGAHLNYQIERWDALAGTAEIWVRVNGVDGNSVKDYITAFWGKPTAKSKSSGEAVFPAGNGFSGVWHLGESGTADRPNSANAGRAAIPTNYDGDETVAGIIGMADSLDGTDIGDYLNLGPLNLNSNNGLTLSLWINSYGTKSAYAHYFDLSNGSGSDNILFGGHVLPADVYFKTWGINTENGTLVATNGVDLNIWTYITASVLGLDVTYYKNGIKTNAGQLLKPITQLLRSQNYLGRSAWDTNPYFKGKIDEPIISQVKRSDDWIKLCYENQRPDSKFITFDKVVEAKLIILTQPSSATIKENAQVALTVVASSGNAITYQWLKNGVMISGANSSALKITAFAVSNTGSYTCKVSDGIEAFETTTADLKLPEDYALWGRSMKIYCNTLSGLGSILSAKETITSVGAGVTGTVVNFPLLIRLNAANFDFSEALENGEDIRFSDLMGAPVSYEIEAWDNQAKEAFIWVRVSEIKGNANQQILNMLWKKSDATTRTNSVAVFRAEDGYRGVWHLSENGSDNAQDAVSKEFSGINKLAIGGEKGVIAGSFRFNGIDSHVEIPLLATSGLSTFTISLWAKEAVSKTAVNLYQTPTVIGMATNNSASGDFGIVSNGGLVTAWHGLGTLVDQSIPTSIMLNNSIWHHLVVTYTGTALNLYESGILIKDSPTAFREVAPSAFALGSSHFSNDTYPAAFSGQVDGLEISSTVRSADWIKLEYENQREGSSMLGFAKAVDQAVVLPPIVVVSHLDTLLPGENIALDAKHDLYFPVQGINTPVRITLEPTWEHLPIGFDSVGALFIVNVDDPKADFPKLQIRGMDSNSQIAIYRKMDNGEIHWVANQGPQFIVPAIVPSIGTYFLARDIAPPTVQSVTSSSHGLDSTSVLVRYRDNVKNIKSRLFFWNGMSDTTRWIYWTPGDSLTFQLPNPVQASLPMEVQVILSDNIQWSYFPRRDRTYTLHRSLPAFTQLFDLKPGYAWRLSGLPLDSTIPIRLGQLGPSGTVIAAVWGKAKQDSDFVLLNSNDVLPRGKGFWLASEKGVNRITIPAASVASTDSNGFFTMRISHGWNMVTCPAFRSLAWPSTRKFTNAYLQADLKGLWRFDGNDYQFADSLRPWEGYYVYHNGLDTVIRLGTTPLGVAKTSANSGLAGAGTSVSGVDLALVLSTEQFQFQSLALGSAHFAVTGLGKEDEVLPPVGKLLGGSEKIWLSRAGKALVTDYVAVDPSQSLSWSLVSQGKHPSYPLKVQLAELPPNVEVWAVSSSRRIKYRLVKGVEIPMVGSDTLMILAGTPEQLASNQDWKMGQIGLPQFSHSIYRATTGYVIEMSLPSAAFVKVKAWGLGGKKLGQLDLGEVGEGHHVWSLVTSPGWGLASGGMAFVEIRIAGRGWKFHRTTKLVLRP
jgi:hypothetical protein